MPRAKGRGKGDDATQRQDQAPHADLHDEQLLLTMVRPAAWTHKGPSNASLVPLGKHARPNGMRSTYSLDPYGRADERAIIESEAPMIPTMIVFGLLTGYWWKFALPAAAIGWSVLLLATGIIGMAQVPGTALLGFVNAAVGIAMIQAVYIGARRMERRAI